VAQLRYGGANFDPNRLGMREEDFDILRDVSTALGYEGEEYLTAMQRDAAGVRRRLKAL
jgi:hypothetical protein